MESHSKVRWREISSMGNVERRQNVLGPWKNAFNLMMISSGIPHPHTWEDITNQSMLSFPTEPWGCIGILLKMMLQVPTQINVRWLKRRDLFIIPFVPFYVLCRQYYTLRKKKELWETETTTQNPPQKTKSFPWCYHRVTGHCKTWGHRILPKVAKGNL